jgi:hypothetical protein
VWLVVHHVVIIAILTYLYLPGHIFSCGIWVSCGIWKTFCLISIHRILLWNWGVICITDKSELSLDFKIKKNDLSLFCLILGVFSFRKIDHWKLEH